MTEAEAINILQLNTPFVASKEANEAVGMAIEALEKQIADKCDAEQIEVDFYEHDCFLCPSCGSFIGYTVDCREEHYQPNYCSYCGQKLDWSEV